MSKAREAAARYWTGDVGERDDFGQVITNQFIDGRTRQGPWAIMAPASWSKHGVGKLGTGYGQAYSKTENGRWIKTEG